MSFLTDAELKAALKDATTDDSAPPGWWDSMVAAANATAYNTILDAFVSRGFKKAKIDQWDRGAELQRAIGVWWFLQEAARMAPKRYSSDAMKASDRRKELAGGRADSLKLLIGGVAQDPETTVGQPTTGRRRGFRHCHSYDHYWDWSNGGC